MRFFVTEHCSANSSLMICPRDLLQARHEKAKDLLNWKPRVSLEQGLERTIQWFRMK